MAIFRWPSHEAFDLALEKLKGLGPKTLARLNEAGFFRLGDLLACLPRHYQDRRQTTPLGELVPENFHLVRGRVSAVKAGRPKGRGRRFLECLLEDGTGRLSLCWFQSPAYLAQSFKKGLAIKAFGLVKQSSRGMEMHHPDFEADAGEDLREKVRPVYPSLAKGEISSGRVKNFLGQGLALLEKCPPLFPEQWLKENEIEDPVQSLLTLHRPPQDFSGPMPRPSETKAFRNLAFFELFFWRLMMLELRALNKDTGLPRPLSGQGLAETEKLISLLPYELSPEQKRAAGEILEDLQKATPMARLLEGEVGGGKTLVAALAAFFTLAQKKQVAIMAPTEVLCRQHFEFFKPYAEALGHNCALFTGGPPSKEKKELKQDLAEGRIHLAVGSQALLAKGLEFRDLGLAIIDEQHRFGVKQRLALRRKSGQVDLLAMSATPIPRSLALVLYGDLAVSSMKSRLPGRSEVATRLFQAGEKREALLAFRQVVERGGQGFVVVPKIGGDGDGPADEKRGPSLEDWAKELEREIPGALAVLHGRLRPEEKIKVMDDFRRGSFRILLATSIIEVGLDVSAAEAILIIGAEYFGLAALHQLRGRVGRGANKGFCFLLAQNQLTPLGAQRLEAMTRLSDGPALAELDLRLRGPGEGLGLRQSGWPGLSFAALPRDLELAEKAQRLAEDFSKNPFPLPPSPTLAESGDPGQEELSLKDVLLD